MIEKKIYIAKDGTVFAENQYSSEEEAKQACYKYEMMQEYVKKDVVLLNGNYEKVSDYEKAYFIIFKNNEIKPTIIKDYINTRECEYDEDIFKDNNYFCYDHQEGWIDVVASCELWQTMLEKLKKIE